MKRKEEPEVSCGLDLGVGSQAVELVRRLVVGLPGAPLAEGGGYLVKGSALRLGHLEVGEDEEEDEQHHEDDEDVSFAKLLKGEGHSQKGALFTIRIRSLA